MKKILIISAGTTLFKLLFQYAEVLKGDFEIGFYFDDSSDKIREEVNIVRRFNFKYYLHHYSEYTKPSDYSFSYKNFETPFWRKVQYKIIPKSKFFKTVFNYQMEEYYVQTVVEDFQPHIILSAQDNFGAATYFLKIARKLNIRSAVTVFTLANQEELGYVFSRLKEYRITTLSQKVFFSVFAKWKIIYHDKAISCELPVNVTAKEVLGISPPNPWLSVGGKSENILVESEFVKEYYKKSGAEYSKMKLVPYPGLESIKKRLKHPTSFISDLKKEYPNITSQPIILCALPPDYFENKLFSNYADIVHFWLTTLTKQHTHQVVISLHPRFDEKKFDFSPYRTIVIKKPIEELLPLCNIFVAQYSATIRLALLCCKQVLNFDMFDAGYTEYANSKLVNTVTTKENFETTLIQLCENQSTVTEENPHYGNYSDNPSLEIKQFFHKLCQKH